MPLLLGNTASAAGGAIGFLSVDNTSGSTITNYVFPATITYSSLISADFSNIKFTYAGQTLSHWVGKYSTSSNAQVYVKVPILQTGINNIEMSLSTSNTSSSSGMFNAFTNFSGAVLGAGWQFTGANSGDYSLSNGNCRIITGNATGIIFVATTANQGQNVRVDNSAIFRAGSIYENCVRFSPSNSSLGIKYRWDGRSNPPEQDWLNNVYSGWANLNTVAPIQRTSNANGGLDTEYIYQVKAVGNNFYSYVNNVPTNINYSSSASNFNQDGIAGVGNHYGPVDLKWIAVYTSYANVSEASYSVAA